MNNDSDYTSAIIAAKQLPIPKNVNDLPNAFHQKVTESHVLVKSISYTGLTASFTEVEGVDDAIFVRTRYWSAENEISRWVPKGNARLYYKWLLNKGFTARA